jgi:hypothetical protein
MLSACQIVPGVVRGALTLSRRPFFPGVGRSRSSVFNARPSGPAVDCRSSKNQGEIKNSGQATVENPRDQLRQPHWSKWWLPTSISRSLNSALGSDQPVTRVRAAFERLPGSPWRRQLPLQRVLCQANFGSGSARQLVISRAARRDRCLSSPKALAGKRSVRHVPGGSRARDDLLANRGKTCARQFEVRPSEWQADNGDGERQGQ